MEIESLYKLLLSSTGVCTDTRTLSTGCFYISLKGENFDGNKFVSYALENGAQSALSDDPENSNVPNCYYVNNCLKTLQDLAHYHRKKLKIPIIGITGTNGKTTTKELILAVLSQKFKVSATKGNLNNHIGVPLTLLAITDTAEIAIVEMGANHLGEIGDLCKIVEPDTGIITNIGKAHLEGFGSFDNIIETKRALYDSIYGNKGVIIVNNDDPLLTELSEGMIKKTYSTQDGDFTYSPTTNGFMVGIKTNEIEISSNLFGLYNATNIAVACLVGLHFGMHIKDIKKGIEGYIPANNRSQTIKTKTNTLLLDAYNANPSSMEAAIRNFAEMQLDNKVLILGEMFELGDDSTKEHAKIASLCNQLQLENTIFIGNWKVTENHFELVTDYKEFLKQNPITNSNILVKGSRGMKLESLIDSL